MRSGGLRWLAWGLLALAVLWVGSFLLEPFTHSITRDAFVESHLVNVAPQVPGTIVEVYAQEQERVRAGQVLARVDPATYASEVELREAALAAAEEAHRKAESDLAVLTGAVPRRIVIARLALARALESEVEAGHAVEAAGANATMAREDEKRYVALARDGSSTTRRRQEATRELHTAEAELGIAEQKLASARHAGREAEARLELANLGDLEIEAGRRAVSETARKRDEAGRALELARVRLAYTEITAPYDAVIAKKWRHVGDYAGAGEPIFSVYDPSFLYVTANLPEDELDGVAPGNEARLDVAAYDGSFRGRVLWVGSATDAKFSLIPRDVSAGEFTYIVQRVPVRIWIERDDRFALLKPGLSVRAVIAHGDGDPEWAAEALREEARLEGLAKPIAEVLP
ncbi:MAG: HlyD family secretion protein [Deltaproteobacteria bacterium]|nr:HlyD family secretion protein [Deltaproteobacteria bacterium]